MDNYQWFDSDYDIEKCKDKILKQSYGYLSIFIIAALIIYIFYENSIAFFIVLASFGPHLIAGIFGFLAGNSNNLCLLYAYLYLNFLMLVYSVCSFLGCVGLLITCIAHYSSLPQKCEDEDCSFNRAMYVLGIIALTLGVSISLSSMALSLFSIKTTLKLKSILRLSNQIISIEL